MAIEVRMPAYSESMEEADVVGWLVQPGDTVSEGDPIAEIETDKATGELESPASGVLSKILVAEGSQNVKVGELLALIEPVEAESESSLEGESASDTETASSDTRSSEEPPTPEAQSPNLADEAQPSQEREREQEISQAAETAPPIVSDADLDAPNNGSSPPAPSTRGTSATALARRLADRAGLDLASISGSGASGRVLKSDVESHSGSLTSAGPGRGQPNTASVGQLALPPQLQLRVDCRTERAQAICNELSTRTPETPIPLLAVIARAAAGALRENPGANRVWLSGELVEPAEVVISLDLSEPNPPSSRDQKQPIDGAPLPNADRMSLAVLAEQILSTSPAADANTGGAGIAALSIIDVGDAAVDSIQLSVLPPATCVLGIGAPSDQPVAINGEVAVARVLTCTLTADSRAFDAKSAARLLDAFKRRLEDPLEMIMG